MGARALIVDDEFGLREMLRVLLQREGYEVMSAEGQSRAEELLDEQPPRLLLRPTDVEILQPVAVHVGGGEVRAFGRDCLGDERLAVEVDEAILAVREVEPGLAGDVGK